MLYYIPCCKLILLSFQSLEFSSRRTQNVIGSRVGLRCKDTYSKSIKRVKTCTLPDGEGWVPLNESTEPVGSGH